jgi:hypothetical protein
MPKNSNLEIVKRWQKLDAALLFRGYWRGMNIPRIAEELGVSAETVERDLKAFEELGQCIDDEQSHVPPVGRKLKGKTYVQTVRHYSPGQQPLFFSSLPQNLRDDLQVYSWEHCRYPDSLNDWIIELAH